MLSIWNSSSHPIPTKSTSIAPPDPLSPSYHNASPSFHVFFPFMYWKKKSEGIWISFKFPSVAMSQRAMLGFGTLPPPAKTLLVLCQLKLPLPLVVPPITHSQYSVVPGSAQVLRCNLSGPLCHLVCSLQTAHYLARDVLYLCLKPRAACFIHYPLGLTLG